jgi:hypothetical protein
VNGAGGRDRDWLSKARKDLAAAEYEVTADPPFAEDILFFMLSRPPEKS